MSSEGKSPIEEAINHRQGGAFDDHNEHDELIDTDDLESNENDNPDMFVSEIEVEDGITVEKAIEINENESLIIEKPQYIANQRQTLLYSATANHKQGPMDVKQLKKVKGIGEGVVRQLPLHIQQ